MEIYKISEHKELIEPSSKWFSDKWSIHQNEYRKSMEASLKNQVPQWYVVIHQQQIIGGIGVIENDFHKRKELKPNACALYVEKQYRHQGIAGILLEYVCLDMKKPGIDTLYLITDHQSFYEKYHWSYLCDVLDDDGHMMRMYRHR